MKNVEGPSCSPRSTWSKEMKSSLEGFTRTESRYKKNRTLCNMMNKRVKNRGVAEIEKSYFRNILLPRATRNRNQLFTARILFSFAKFNKTFRASSTSKSVTPSIRCGD